jgi:hypothetical protein
MKSAKNIKMKDWDVWLTPIVDGDSEKWIATISEQPNFRTESETYEDAARSVMDYRRMIDDLNRPEFAGDLNS